MVDVPGVASSTDEETNNSKAVLLCAYELCNVMQNLKLCSGCQDAWYCSEDHQKKHWRTHRIKCKVQMAELSREDHRITVQGRQAFPGNVGVYRRNGNVTNIGPRPYLSDHSRPRPPPSHEVFTQCAAPAQRYKLPYETLASANRVPFPMGDYSQAIDRHFQPEAKTSRSGPNRVIDPSLVVSSMPGARTQVAVTPSVNQKLTAMNTEFQGSFESDPIVAQDTDQFSDHIRRSSSYPLSPAESETDPACASASSENDRREVDKSNARGGNKTTCTFTLGEESTGTSASIISSKGNSNVKDPPFISSVAVSQLGLKTSLLDYITKWMQTYGICVLDRFLSEDEGLKILEEIKTLYNKGKFKAGQLVKGRGGGSSKEIRGDLIMWTDGTEPDCVSIGNLISKMDSIVMGCQGKSSEFTISGRTKAMLACYPGNGTQYVKHVDNPSCDGRRITCIYYLNKNWDSQINGGLLRIYPEGQDIVANIEPLFNRLLLFWSDRRNPHEVFPAYATRYAVTVWYFDEEERSKAKISA